VERNAAGDRTGVTALAMKGLASLAIMACALFGAAAPAIAQGNPGQMPQIFSMEVAWSPTKALAEQMRLSAALSSLQPQRPGVTDVYVVSAGTWSDPVFAREATEAGRILTERYRATGRSVVLTMGGDDRPSNVAFPTPLAINSVFGRIGQLMDPNEDVLVFFVTSHGSLQSGVSIRDAGRSDGSLMPNHLRAALDDAKIKNRVVIISACHSGMFIPALSTPETVVLTAASFDRVSFGCQPQNNWTYFGDALFAQSLTPQRTLLASFDRARGLIESWEKRDGFPSSQPQKFVGANAPVFLARIEPRV
jgi:hypothetical protein